MELWWNIFWDLFKYCNLWKWISNTKNVIKHHLQACLKLNTLNAWCKSHYVRYSWKKMGCPRWCVNRDATYGIKEFLVWIDYNKTSISFIVNLVWFLKYIYSCETFKLKKRSTWFERYFWKLSITQQKAKIILACHKKCSMAYNHPRLSDSQIKKFLNCQISTRGYTAGSQKKYKKFLNLFIYLFTFIPGL
jgi:hypothetical protein